MEKDTVALDLSYYHKLKDYEKVVSNGYVLKKKLNFSNRYIEFVLTNEDFDEEIKEIVEQNEKLQEEVLNCRKENNKLEKEKAKIIMNNRKSDNPSFDEIEIISETSFFKFLKIKFGW